MPRHPSEQSNMIPALFYEDAKAALAWLEKAFGFERSMVITDKEGKLAHSEMKFGDGYIKEHRLNTKTEKPLYSSPIPV